MDDERMVAENAASEEAALQAEVKAPAATEKKPAKDTKKRKKANSSAIDVNISFEVPASISPQLQLICMIRNQKASDVVSQVIGEYLASNSDQIASRIQKYVNAQAKELQSILS